MTTERLVSALLKGEPYFGSAMAALQGEPERHAYLERCVELLVERSARPSFRILEVGSWAGASAITLARALGAHSSTGEIICIDTWAPYFDLDVDNQSLYLEMDKAAESGDIFHLFQHNIRAAGAAGLVSWRRGRSSEILPTLPPESFDLIYLDGSHAYRDVLTDIRQSMELIRDDGILCGDDLELTKAQVDATSHARFVATGYDYALDPQIKKSYHPGVTEAVAETFGELSGWNGFWAVRRKETWQPLDLGRVKPAVPSHLRAAASEPRTEIVAALRGFNVMRRGERFVALLRDLSFLPSASAWLPDRDVPPVLFVGESLEDILAKVSAAVVRAEAAIELIETAGDYNVVRIGDRYAAFRHDLGPLDLRREFLGERDVPPCILVGDSSACVRDKIRQTTSAQTGASQTDTPDDVGAASSSPSDGAIEADIERRAAS
ncbi:MAG: class I SAM-dependent methyltransferase [Alphaproteobacteria bacterium]